VKALVAVQKQVAVGLVSLEEDAGAGQGACGRLAGGGEPGQLVALLRG
jgi:hypothetical protein